MTSRKRRFDGPPTQERRQVDSPVRVPPHRKPKRYRLCVEWTTTRTYRRSQEFETMAAVEEAQRRLARDFQVREERAQEMAGQRRHLDPRWYRDDPCAGYEAEELSRILTPPRYSVTALGTANEPVPSGGADVAPPCVCQGNWRQLVAECEGLIGQRLRDTGSGEIFHFFGLVHGEDDYYYGLSGAGGTRLLSCVGSLESHGYAWLETRTG